MRGVPVRRATAMTQGRSGMRKFRTYGSERGDARKGVPYRDLSHLARFGPTTPTRAGRLADASVDHTEARNTQKPRMASLGLCN